MTPGLSGSRAGSPWAGAAGAARALPNPRAKAEQRTARARVASLAESGNRWLVIPSLVALPITGCMGFILLLFLVPSILGLAELLLAAQFPGALVLLAIGLALNVVVFSALYLLVTLHRRRPLIIGTDGLALTTLGRRAFLHMDSVNAR